MALVPHIALTMGMKIPPQQQGRGGGVLGALVADREGSVFGVTARYVLINDTSPVVFDGWTQILGRRVDFAPVTTSPQPMFCAIGLFRVSSTVSVDPSIGRLRQLPNPAGIKGLIGQPLQKIDHRGRHGAVVTRLFGSLRVVNVGEPQSHRYYDAIEIEPVDPDAFGISGDAGALVTTETNAPVGLLIAGAGRRYFLAPLQPLCAVRDLHFLTAKEAAVHNDSAAFAQELRLSGDDPMNGLIAELAEHESTQEKMSHLGRPFPPLPRQEKKKSALARALEIA